MTLKMTLTGYLALNSVFAPVWLAETTRLRKIITYYEIYAHFYIDGVSLCERRGTGIERSERKQDREMYTI